MLPTPSPCHHVFPTGKQCGSPALRHELYCFYHHPTRRPSRTAPVSRFYLPPLASPETIQIALAEVTRRLADGTLDTRRAALLIQTIQTARANLAALNDTAACAPAPKVPSGSPKSPDLAELSALLSALGPRPSSISS